MSKERTKQQKTRYKENRARVYDIYGIPKKERGRKYDMHHIIFRQEGGGDDKANLCPLIKKVHQELHKKVWENERKRTI